MANALGAATSREGTGMRNDARGTGWSSRAWGVVGAAVVATVLLTPAEAEAAKVKGKIANFIYLKNPVWEEAKSPKKKGYSFREAVPTVPSKFRNLFPHIPKEVCIAALAKSAQKPPKPILIRVGGGRTTPVTIVVPPKTQFTFKNTDPFRHQLFGVKVPTFNPANTMKNATRDWTVPKTGVFEIRDKRAPSLRMWIIAEPNVAARAYPNLKGEFLFNLPDGDYDLQAYFAGKTIGPKVAVTVSGKKDIELKDAIKVAPDPPKKKGKGKGKDEEKK